MAGIGEVDKAEGKKGLMELPLIKNGCKFLSQMFAAVCAHNIIAAT